MTSFRCLIVNFKHISHLLMVFLWLTLKNTQCLLGMFLQSLLRKLKKIKIMKWKKKQRAKPFLSLFSISSPNPKLLKKIKSQIVENFVKAMTNSLVKFSNKYLYYFLAWQSGVKKMNVPFTHLKLFVRVVQGFLELFGKTQNVWLICTLVHYLL